MIEWLFNQSSQALGTLAFFGSLAGVWRWRRAARQDLLLAFVMFLVGTSLREAVVYQWGNTQWDALPLLLSTVARLLQIGGAVLFIRGATMDVCRPWMMVTFLLAVTFFVMVV